MLLIIRRRTVNFSFEFVRIASSCEREDKFVIVVLDDMLLVTTQETTITRKVLPSLIVSFH